MNLMTEWPILKKKTTFYFKGIRIAGTWSNVGDCDVKLTSNDVGADPYLSTMTEQRESHSH